MDNDEIDIINDWPYELGQDEEVGAFLVRYCGEKRPFGMILASSFVDLFWSVDIQTNPYDCECTALIAGDAYFIDGEMSEGLEDRFGKKRAWRSVGDGIREYYEREHKEFKLARLENEVADLGGILKDLKRKANDRFNGHRRRARQDAGSLEKAGSRKDHTHGGAGAYRIRPHCSRHFES